MSRPVVEYELDTDSLDVRPVFLRWKDQLHSADLYELTTALFWADIRFRHDSGELRWQFRRKGGDVLIFGEIPDGRARMTLPVFVEFAAEHLESVLKDLCKRFPASRHAGWATAGRV